MANNRFSLQVFILLRNRARESWVFLETVSLGLTGSLDKLKRSRSHKARLFALRHRLCRHSLSLPVMIPFSLAYLFRVLRKLHNLTSKVNVIVFERPQKNSCNGRNKNPAGEYALKKSV